MPGGNNCGRTVRPNTDFCEPGSGGIWMAESVFLTSLAFFICEYQSHFCIAVCKKRFVAHKTLLFSENTFRLLLDISLCVSVCGRVLKLLKVIALL